MIVIFVSPSSDDTVSLGTLQSDKGLNLASKRLRETSLFSRPEAEGPKGHHDQIRIDFSNHPRLPYFL